VTGPLPPRPYDDRTDGSRDGPARRHLGVVEGPARDAEFDELYRRELTPMLRLGYLLTSDRDAAAEIAHEAFITTYERWDRLDNPGGYLRTAVVNRCNDHHRRRVRRRTHSVAVVADDTVKDPDDVLADVIARLKPKRRAAVVLRYYLDLPQAEIAEVLGVRPGTVKSLLHRALAELRTALAEPDDPPHGPPTIPADTDTHHEDER
jgi:RNA polymerase sigma-70 factor (sigma-E family)